MKKLESFKKEIKNENQVTGLVGYVKHIFKILRFCRESSRIVVSLINQWI